MTCKYIMRHLFDTEYHYLKARLFYKRQRYKGGSKLIRKPIILHGGDETKKFKYKDYKFKVKKYYEEEKLFIVIHAYKDENIECAILTKEPNSEVIQLENLGNYPECAKPFLPSEGGGKILLKAIVRYLKQNKESLDIKRVILVDNAKTKCGSDTISLSRVLMLTKRESYYGQFNFIPYDLEHNIQHEIEKELYFNNRDILKNLKLKDFNLSKLIEKNVHLNSQEKEILINELKSFDENKKITVVFDKLFRKHCLEMKKISTHIYLALGLYDFSEKAFYYDL